MNVNYSQPSQYEQLHLHSKHVKLVQCPNTCSAFSINDILYFNCTGYEAKWNRDDEMNDERFHLYVPAMSPHPWLRLSWKKKNQILMECARLNVTENLNGVRDICELAINQLNLALPPSLMIVWRMIVRRIINNATIVRRNAISLFKKARKC